MELQERIKAFVQLGTLLRNQSSVHSRQSAVIKAYQHNQWFTPDSIQLALTNISSSLTDEKLNHWLDKYELSGNKNQTPKNIGVIMAGNIPLVGFHDALCVLMSGNNLVAKLSKADAVLLPFLMDLLIAIEPSFKPQIQFVERLEKPDAVIATGSNNSARYFEYYFGKYPHIIRKNRNSAAIITGDETTEELKHLGQDIFTYFGLGCRNVSKLYVPARYDFDQFYKSIESFSTVMEHNKYMNNYDYNHAVYLLNKEPFLTNNFLIIRESAALATPVSVLNYEYYSTLADLERKLKQAEDQLQCVTVAGNPWKNISIKTIPFGTSQNPPLDEYADGIDTMKFLVTLSS